MTRKLILSFCLLFVSPLIASSGSGTDDRYGHFPPQMRGQAYDFETEWNTQKASVPPTNILREYVSTVIQADFDEQDFKKVVMDILLPESPEERISLQTAFWTPEITTLFTREGNAFSQYFLSVFSQSSVGPLTGEYDANALLEMSGSQLYPRANAALLTRGIDDEKQRTRIQDRYDRIVCPQRFVREYIRRYPRPQSITDDKIEQIMEAHITSFPGNPDIYRQTQADLMFLLGEDIKWYSPYCWFRSAYLNLGCLTGTTDRYERMIENHAGMMAVYLTFLHKEHLYHLPDREAREHFWRVHVPRWGKIIRQTVSQHRRDLVYPLSWAILDNPETAWEV